MTIEAKLDALIAALNANTAALQASQAIKDAKAPTAPPAAPKAAAPAPAAPKAPAAPQAPAAPKATPPAPTALNYMKDVQPIALKLVNAEGGRPKMVEILSKYGVKLGAELKPDQLQPFLTDVKAALEALGVKV